MIWIVWNEDGETAADGVRIEASTCEEAAAEWAALDAAADPKNAERHLTHGLLLCVRGPEHRVKVKAEAEVRYYMREEL